jgi:hypothetical protein
VLTTLLFRESSFEFAALGAHAEDLGIKHEFRQSPVGLKLMIERGSNEFNHWHAFRIGLHRSHLTLAA